jgi:hypothetical protein
MEIVYGRTIAMTNNGQVDLIAFLDYLGSKGLMTGATVAARKAAVRTLLGVLDEAETADITTLDLDEVSRRLLNKRGSEFKPDSLKVYKSRVASAIEDFKRYRADPLNFKTNITPKTTTRPKPHPKETSGSERSQSHPQPRAAFFSPSESEMVFPIPIRPNTIVKLVGVPSDLTKQEAARIANVINALATADDE